MFCLFSFADLDGSSSMRSSLNCECACAASTRGKLQMASTERHSKWTESAFFKSTAKFPSTANWVQSFRKLRSSNHSLRETNRPLWAANYIDADKETDCKLSSGPSALENYAFIDCKLQERNRVCGVQSTPSSRIEIAKLTVEMCSQSSHGHLCDDSERLLP